jgi:hypothetical protein
MICPAQSRKQDRSFSNPRGVPSPTRIRELTAEIRNGWSPATRARRAGQGANRVEIMMASARELAEALKLHDQEI